MNYDLRQAAKQAEPFTKESAVEDAYWYKNKYDGEKYFVPLIQVFVDKSQVNLKTTSFTFYYITVIHFREEER